MKELRLVSLVLIVLLLAAGCNKGGKELTDDEKKALPPTINCADGVSAVFQSVFSSGVFFAANYFPRQNGAVGDGQNDDTDAIALAIDKAAQAGGGVVYLDRGTYRVTKQIVIGSNVKLIGDFNSPTAKNATSQNTVICLDGDFSETSPFVLSNGATLSDMIIYNENQNAADPKSLAPTITAEGAAQVTIKNLLMPNSANGISLVSETLERVTLKNIYLSSFFSAITIDGKNISVTADNINISPSYIVSSNQTNSDNVLKYDDEVEAFKQSLTAFYANVKSFTARTVNIDASFYAMKLLCNEGTVRVTNMSTTNTQNAVSLDGSVLGGAMFSGCTFSALIAEQNNGFFVADTCNASVVFSNCVFTGRPTYALNVAGNARVSCNGCNFVSWKTAAMLVSNGIVSVSESTLTPDTNMGEFSDNAVGVFYGNSYFSVLKTRGGQIFSSTAALQGSSVPLKTWQTPNGSTMTPKRTQVYNAADYGLGTGSASAAIQQAVDDAAANGGGIVFVTEGSYQLTQTLILRENVWLSGVGTGENHLTTKLFCAGDFEGEALVELKKDSAIINAQLSDEGYTIVQAPGAYSLAGIVSYESNVMAENVKITDFADGISFFGSASPVIRNVSSSSFRHGFVLQNTENAVLYGCTYNLSTSASLSAYAAENGIAFYFTNSAMPEIFDCFANGASIGIRVEKNLSETTKEDESGICVINGITTKNVSVGIYLHNCSSVLLSSSLTAQKQAVFASLAENDSFSAFATSFISAPVYIENGKITLYGNVFSQTQNEAVFVSGGRVEIMGGAFEQPSLSAHLSANGGNTTFDANIIVSETLYNGSSSGYLKTQISGDAVVADNYNLKRVDYENVD